MTAGLFASVADKEVPCRVAGCKKSWTWWGSEQIKAFGQAPPKRMCDEHLAAFHELNDKEVPCRNSGCENTWTWKRGAQLHLIQRQEKLKTPRRLCESCAGEEKSITDTQVPCRTPGCAHTWTWPADAQRRHASWLRREQAKLEEAEAKHNAPAPVETPAVDSSAATKTRADDQPVSAEAKSPHEVVPASNESRSEPGAETPGAETPGAEAAGAETPASETPGSNDVNESTPAVDVDAAPTPAAEDAPAPKKRKRRRRKSKRQKKLQEGPPEKLCGHCSEQIKKLEPLEQSCKVHGCKNTWSWDREHQLRAWVAAGSQTEQGASAAPKAQRRMCISCRDFCRANHDRAVQCGKPECEKTWTYKTGAQLQDQLAGRVADPIKLCEDCMKEQFMAPGVQTGALPEGSEVMPCAVGGCEGTWIYVPGMQLAAVEGDDVPTDRMCDKCRGERDLDARGTIVPAPGHVTEAASKDAEPSAVAGSDASSAQATRSSEDVSEAPAHAAVASESVAPESEEAAKVAVDQAEGGTESPTEGSTDS